MQKIKIPLHLEEEEGVEVVVEGSEEAFQIEVEDHLQHVAPHSEGLPLVIVVLLEGHVMAPLPLVEIPYLLPVEDPQGDPQENHPEDHLHVTGMMTMAPPLTEGILQGIMIVEAIVTVRGRGRLATAMIFMVAGIHRMNEVEVAAVQVEVAAVTPVVSVDTAHQWIEVMAAQTVTAVLTEDTLVTGVMMTGMVAALEVPEVLHTIVIFQREAVMVVNVRRGVVMTPMVVVEEAMAAVSEVMVDPSAVIPHLIVGMGPLLSERGPEATVDLPPTGLIHLGGPILEAATGDEVPNRALRSCDDDRCFLPMLFILFQLQILAVP